MRRPAPGGYFGRALIVDLGTGASSVQQLDESVLRSYVGGAGLGAWLMHQCCPPGIDALAPEAPLIFVFSPLVGTPLTTSAKFAVVAKSPLTGRSRARVDRHRDRRRGAEEGRARDVHDGGEPVPL